jgi:HEAT repeat protein
LQSNDSTDRYAAIKAAGALQLRELRERLVAIARDDQDWRIRLEALVSLARIDPGEWVDDIASFGTTVPDDDTLQMESMLALSEIPSVVAANALVEVAKSRDSRPDEVRAAAVWGLGTGSHADPSRLVSFTTDSTDLVAVHAAAALRTLPDDVVATLYRMLHSEDDRAAAVAAQVLARHHQIELLVEAACEAGTARLWALRALGDIPPEQVVAAVGTLPATLRESLEPIWIQHRDWLRAEAIGPLDALATQQIRYDPVTASYDAPELAKA